MALPEGFKQRLKELIKQGMPPKNAMRQVWQEFKASKTRNPLTPSLETRLDIYIQALVDLDKKISQTRKRDPEANIWPMIEEREWLIEKIQALEKGSSRNMPVSNVKVRLAKEYVKKIKNQKKKRYADAYLHYLLGYFSEEPSLDSPEYSGLGYMAMQSVRMNLNEILSGGNPKRKFHVKGQFIRERIRSPKGLYHMRTIVHPSGHRVIIGCPEPHKGKRCPVGTVAQAILHPMSEKRKLLGKKNPIAVYNRPAGVLPAKNIEINYQRTGGQYAGELFKHKFKNPVKLLALNDGSLLIKPTKGHKLWGYY